jgi:pimeloyl-ACP methyl ester carboxylesterase
MATFVLVHGAWHGGWCWYKLVTRLEARGHRVLAPDLPGHGVDRSLARAATYSDYVSRITDILDAESDPVVLVGHSMGGAIVTGAAEALPEKVQQLVYLCAFLAPSGLSMFEGAAAGRSAAAAEIVPAADGQSTLFKPDALRSFLYADCPDEDIALARLCLAPQSIEPMTAPIVWTPERAGRIPRTYIACSEDRIKGGIEEQRAAIEQLPGTEFIALNASHSPFFSIPDELADTLERLLRVPRSQ